MSGEDILDAELIDDENTIPVFQSKKIGPMSLPQLGAIGLVILLLSSTVLFNIFSEEEVLEPEDVFITAQDNTVFVTDSTGMPVNVAPIDMEFFASSVGEDAAEPSIGVTSTGCIFFIAFEKVMRSCDYGGTWEEKQDPIQCSPTTSDHMAGLTQLQIGYSMFK